MAKRRSRSSRNRIPSGRIAVVNARSQSSDRDLHRLLNQIVSAPIQSSRASTYGDFTYVSDNRRFNPEPYPRAVLVSGAPTRLIVPNPMASRKRAGGRNAFRLLSPRIAVAQPSKVIECLRRKRRKEVIHARGIAGTRVAKPTLDYLSKLHCR